VPTNFGSYRSGVTFIKLNPNASISSKTVHKKETCKYHAIQVLRTYCELFWPARIFNETGYKEK
jgi:hypothetical protein